MFESILGHVLLSNLGKFVSGIDKNNFKLGLWSGNIVLNNVSLNPEFIHKFDLPLEMAYSHVGKLSLQVPWKSLNSAPVEVVLEDVFLIVKPIEERAWAVDDYKLMLQKLEVIDHYFTTYFRTESKEASAEQKKSSQGLVSKLTTKILDNLQVISNSLTTYPSLLPLLHNIHPLSTYTYPFFFDSFNLLSIGLCSKCPSPIRRGLQQPQLRLWGHSRRDDALHD